MINYFYFFVVLLRPDKENKFGNVNPQFIIKTVKINESERNCAIEQLVCCARYCSKNQNCEYQSI